MESYSLLVQMAGGLLGHLDAGDLLLVRCQCYFFPIERRACLVVPRICTISETKLSIDYSGKKKKVVIVLVSINFPSIFRASARHPDFRTRNKYICGYLQQIKFIVR